MIEASGEKLAVCAMSEALHPRLALEAVAGADGIRKATVRCGRGRSGSREARSVQSEEDVLQWLAKEYGLSYTTLENIEPDRQLLSLFPARILLKEQLLPLRRVNGSAEVATSRLFATQGLDALKTLTGLSLKPVLASTEAIQREIKKHLGVGADTIDTLHEEKSFQVVDDDIDDTNLDAPPKEASIIHFVNQVLRDAIELRASDIHLEPFEDEFRIRYRIDGVLQDVPCPAQLKRFQPAIVSRVKILSHLNIAEKRLPQDGRIKIRIDEAEVDIRVSVIPMLHGEAVVMRLLRQNATLRGMSELDMESANWKLSTRPPVAARHHPGHGPDRQRQDLDAVHGAERNQ
jgi:type II secretory ATPase GspE/PulE/Tfp pilus assembly ATPase PilB-like protein